MFSMLAGVILQFFMADSARLPDVYFGTNTVLSRREMSLSYRYPDVWVSDIFRKNILLTLGYMRGVVTSAADVSWEEVDKPFVWAFILSSGRTVSYHSIVLEKYRDAMPLVGIHFSGSEGFLYDGILFGGGTCHLASLLSWAAKDAGLTVFAPTNHDFAAIPQIPREQGVSVYSNPHAVGRSVVQNVYITNDFETPVEFIFDYDGDTLSVTVREAKTPSS